MKIRFKGIAFLLAVILTFPSMLSGSAAILHSSTPPTEPNIQATTPTVLPSTGSTIPATTVPPTTVPPTTVPPTTEPTTQPTSPPSENLTASHAFLYRCSDDSFLFLKGTPEDRIYPASITKLFTAYVALQYLEPDRQITVGDAIYTVPPDSSLAFISIGEVFTTEQLLHGMLLPSGGDAARVIAAETGRVISGNTDLSAADAIALCIEEMNRQAGAQGMTGSHFVTPDGFHDSDHYTTMADLLILTELCLDDPLIRQIVSTREYPITLSGRDTSWRNTNMLLSPSSPHPEFYRETAIGLKTGFTGTAGRCLLAAFIIDGETFFAGVFGCPDPNWGYIAQFENICYLYDTYLAQ